MVQTTAIVLVENTGPLDVLWNTKQVSFLFTFICQANCLQMDSCLFIFSECKQLYTHRECTRIPVSRPMKVKETECQKCIRYYETVMETKSVR